MILLLFAFLLALIITTLLITLAWVVSFRMNQDREKASPFECGFDPKGSARLPFSMRFFLLAVIFLIFDLEIVLILPAPIIMNFSSMTTSMINLLGFLLILLVGLFHEWREGSLNWSG
uniref:NADH-ubiquinone oxidoreductase chain 3 n=1 Tax=Magelona mirabilis TaxID=46598 RepID=A0A0S2N0F4_9ANNE|nr:NADH dehydrogenase subunit 3 [Magelona mirabilis]ALO81684.1 NADH dehydrogenase subunit 3 [Magelona mirabilis]